jgi:hypothetical protein
MQLMAHRLALAVSFVLVGCEWSPALTSDPAFWDPPRTGEPLDGSPRPVGDAAAIVDPACRGEPRYDAALLTSSATASSHRPGESCLKGCHETGGSAKAVFAAAGTVYQSQRSREVATSGVVQSVGGTALAVDRCGNIYAVASALKTGVQLTQPFVQNPTFHRMDKSLYRVTNAGSCNQSDCHDFSGKLRWGVYF